MDYVKISENRMGAVIGKEGEVKDRIEKELKVKIYIDSKDGLVEIENIGEDPLGGWKAKDVIRAINYGVLPETALKLKNDEYSLIVVNLFDIVGRSKKALTRQKARVIGRRGNTKSHISELTGAEVSVAGKHVAIIGRIEEVQIAKNAVEALAGGVPHGVVYKVLEKKCSDMRKNRNIEMWRNR
jgi:ribosomal RNA assembly protein